MSKELVILDAEQFGVEKSKAQDIENTFVPMVKMLKGFEKEYEVIIAEKEMTPELAGRARRLRLDIGKVRIETGKLKDKRKEYIKLEDKAIMGVHNILVHAVKEKEDNLKKIENHLEIIEQERMDKLKEERVIELEEYEMYNVAGLGEMDDDVYKNFIAGAKFNHDAKIEAERKAEEEKLENERIENLRLKRSDELRPYYDFFDGSGIQNLGKLTEEEYEDALSSVKSKKAVHDKKQEDIRIENENLKKEREEEEKRQSKEKEEREKREKEERERHEKALQEEREKAEKLERELKEKKEAEEKAEENKQALIEANLNKGDSSKLKDLVDDLEVLKGKYEFKSAKNKKMYEDVHLLIDKVIGHINK